MLTTVGSSGATVVGLGRLGLLKEVSHNIPVACFCVSLLEEAAFLWATQWACSKHRSMAEAPHPLTRSSDDVSSGHSH